MHTEWTWLDRLVVPLIEWLLRLLTCQISRQTETPAAIIMIRGRLREGSYTITLHCRETDDAPDPYHLPDRPEVGESNAPTL